jgi:hypothetical protein
VFGSVFLELKCKFKCNLGLAYAAEAVQSGAVTVVPGTVVIEYLKQPFEIWLAAYEICIPAKGENSKWSY